MMDSKMSAAAGLISIVNKAANLGSFISLILWCIICSWIITFQDFYTCFRRVFHLFSYLLLDSWKRSHHHSRNVSTPERVCCAGNDVSRDDVEVVMEKLGLLRGQRAEEQITMLSECSLESVVNVFDGVEPSLGELREAFEVFDENSDGFIDGGELRRVMSCIGLTGFSEEECRRMIMVFDDNCDGKIDFGEFVKLMEDCFCCCC
ncbi:UNVERIFIED_CONTAM: putative calcium-binding protein CML46 [Sesamum indicum]